MGSFNITSNWIISQRNIVRVHMNVVPRSTMNTNGETEN